MSGCTAPIRGHRTASGLAACPVCGGRGYGYRAPVYYFSSNSYAPQSGYISNGSHVGSSARPRWSPDTSSVTYTKDEVRALTPVRNAIESRTQLPPESYDVFLCHAWDDRRGIATELHDRLQTQGVSVWFSEKNIILGQPFLREIDKGLAKSRVGLVLVTPAFLERIRSGGVSEKELSALLARDLLFPVIYKTTFDELRNVSPLLVSRNGLDANEDPLEDIVTKIAELVTFENS